jgi:hypothetical protein
MKEHCTYKLINKHLNQKFQNRETKKYDLH